MTIAKAALRKSDLPGRFDHAPSHFVPLASFSAPKRSSQFRPPPPIRQALFEPAMSGGLEGRRSCGAAVMGEAWRGQTNRFAATPGGTYN